MILTLIRWHGVLRWIPLRRILRRVLGMVLLRVLVVGIVVGIVLLPPTVDDGSRRNIIVWPWGHDVWWFCQSQELVLRRRNTIRSRSTGEEKVDAGRSGREQIKAVMTD